LPFGIGVIVSPWRWLRYFINNITFNGVGGELGLNGVSVFSVFISLLNISST
jgi:hypothetical protein